MRLRALLIICSLFIFLASCKKEKSYPKNLEGTWELHSIQTLKIDGNEVNEAPLDGDSFIRMIFEVNNSTFTSYFSWNEFSTYDEGNAGEFWFGPNYNTLTLSWGQTEQIEHDIVKLGKNKMILNTETISDLDGLLHEEEYIYKKVNWTP